MLISRKINKFGFGPYKRSVVSRLCSYKTLITLKELITEFIYSWVQYVLVIHKFTIRYNLKVTLAD